MAAMAGATLLERARCAAGLSQEDLAQRAHTSRTAVSAYENGRKSPSLSTVERLLAGAGYELDARPHITFQRVTGTRGHSYDVPDRLPQLPPEQALATVQLPLRLNWSDPGRVFRMADRNDCARVYETILREGTGDDVLTYIAERCSPISGSNWCSPAIYTRHGRRSSITCWPNKCPTTSKRHR